MSDDIPRQFAARRGFSVSYKGKLLLSKIDPIAQGERVVQGISQRDRTLYFCPSPLYGYGLEGLLAALGDDSAVLCVEADEKLLSLSQQALGELLLKNPSLRLVGSCDPQGLCSYIRETWGSPSFRRVEVLRLSGGWQLDSPLYESLEEAIRQDIGIAWGNAMTLMKLGRRYIRNAIRNLALLPRARRIGDLDFGDSPVLVLGAGPSLDRVLEGAAYHFGKNLDEPQRPFRIICVDTALQALKERNIKPDLLVALESQHWNLRDFIGSGSWEIPVAMDLSALPATQEVLGGKIFLFATPWTRLRFFLRLHEAGLLPETLPPLGSVGLTAVALARRISSGPILLGGLDFSYTLERFHARSTPGHRENLGRQTRFRSLLNGEAAFASGTFTLLSKSGLPVRSNPAMKNYQNLFKQEFAGDPRIQDIEGPGLPLGVGTLSLEAACKVLQGGKPRGTISPGAGDPGILGTAEAFMRRERGSLIILRDMMSRSIPLDPLQLEILLDELDYLWSHFPECAGTGRRPSGRDIPFLKRVRMEIDPLVRLFDQGLQTLGEEHQGEE